MAQKDKVKELVGRGLDSYHTKALQQIDRINKKNKEQNHKISILTNELDNDYLTKTEEGSVISLEHSKEGMVYLDELQGNTLVNYCTDGSKELTLNGDIDIEGTFVTTTEGVDNGKVDVMCEGNTLVNLATIKSVTLSNTGSKVISNLTFKQDTKYTLIFDVDSNSVTNESHEGIYLWFSADGITPSTVSALDLKGRKKYVMTRSDNANGWGIGCRNDLSGTVILNNILILEGDWTDREVPSYFEGMKSVGQDNTNGHKIEILSKNRNLFDGEWELGSINSSTGQLTNTTLQVRSVNFMKVKQGQILTFSYPSEKNIAIRMYDKDKKYLGATELFKPDGSVYSNDTRTVPNNVHYMKFKIIETDLNFQLQVEEGSTVTEYKQQQLNKKEILLSEPLRGLPNGVKDRPVRIGGKWFIERNCAETYITVPSSGVNIDNIQENRCRIVMADYPSNILPNQSRNTVNLVCNKIPYVKQYDIDNTNPNYSYGIATRLDTVKGIYMWVTTDKMPNQTLDGFKEFINNNQPKIIYQLETPIYEPLEIVPELTCYDEVTHFSNNSIIPCTMKVKNSGYNAIIKPSTLYTVALDTNKSGTIGMNLGGAKVTTTNNVATITTPATLADDSLRLYGKGIKGSKVRLLEGDKTNWIPSHFEGMKSSFEDKFDEVDNCYKMEILSNNENLFDTSECKIPSTQNFTVEQTKNNGYKITVKVGNSGWVYTSKRLPFKLKPNTKYEFSCDISKSNANSKPCARIYNLSKNISYGTLSTTGKFTFVTPSVGLDKIELLLYSSIDNVPCNVGDIMEFNNIKISEVMNKDFISKKSNKIQFLLDEPLRSVDIVKDRLCIKDNKLMIERNCGEIVLNGTETISEQTSYNKSKTNMYEIQKTLARPNGHRFIKSDCFSVMSYAHDEECISSWDSGNMSFLLRLNKARVTNIESVRDLIRTNNIKIVYKLVEPRYEEIPFELQKIILEGYENGTLFLDTNIPPTSTIKYAGETPIVKSAKSNRVEVASNTTDINDNIIPYLCDMDYRIVTLELQQQLPIQTGMFKLFGGVYEMLKRDILSKRLSKSEYQYRLTDYFTVGKLTEQQVRELEDLINE